jgi:hypothetical protein
MSARPTDVSVVRALHGAAWVCSGRTIGRRHASENHAYRPGRIGARSDGISVFMAARFASYATTFRAGRTTSHRPRAVYIAWRRGRPVGRLVVTWCGHRLVTAVLTEDPGCSCQACRLCDLRVDGPRCCESRGCCA